MSNRVRVGLISTIVVLAFLLPGATDFMRWFPLLGVAILIVLSSFELNRALVRRLPEMSFIPALLGIVAALSPGLVWLWYENLTFWHNLPIGGSLPAQFLMNDAWLTNYVWLMGVGLAIYAGSFILSQFIYASSRIIAGGPERLPIVAVQIAAALSMSFPLALVTLMLFAVPNGYKWLLYAFLISVTTDVSAYYVGSVMGKKTIVPNLSPKKTVEGFFGGLLMSALVSAVFFHFVMRGGVPQMEAVLPNLGFGIALGIVVSLASQVSDWLASGVKRWCKIKDFSRILGDHGGILDRCDSLIGTIPWTFLGSLIYYFIER